MFNVMYADADGHILYVFNGAVPERSMGDVATWNATQPDSRHNGDQLELYSRQEMRTPWRVRAEIEANLEARTDLGGGGR